jgi:hypothetical protein
LENFPALASQIKLEKSKWSKAKKKKQLVSNQKVIQTVII